MAAESRRRYKTWSHYTLLVSSILHLVNFTIGSPVFSHSSFFPQVQTGRNIRHLPCVVKRSGLEGICMFAIDCLKSNGTHLGTCIDKFYFGSCCQLEQHHFIETGDITDNSIDHNPLPNYNHYSSSSSSSSISSSTSLIHKKPYSTSPPPTLPSSSPSPSTSSPLVTSSHRPTTTAAPSSSHYYTKPSTHYVNHTRRTRPTTTAAPHYSSHQTFATQSSLHTTIKPLKDEVVTVGGRPETTTENTRLSTFQSIQDVETTTKEVRTTTVKVTKRPTVAETTRKPVKTTPKPTKRPVGSTTTRKTSKKPVATRKPTTSVNNSTRPVLVTRPVTTTYTKKPEISTQAEGLSTISYVETTRAPRPKPKPTSEIFIVPTVTEAVVAESNAPTSTAQPFSTFSSIDEKTTTQETTTRRRPTTTTTMTTTEPTTTTTSTTSTTTANIAPSKPQDSYMIVSSSTSTSSTYETTESMSVTYSTSTSTTASPSTSTDKISSYADIVQEVTLPTRTEGTTLDSGLVTWTIVDGEKPNGGDSDNAWPPHTPDEWVLIHTLSPNTAASQTGDISDFKYNVSAPSIFETTETSTEAMTPAAPEKTETVTSTEASSEGSPVSFTWTTEPSTVPTFIEISTISPLQNASTPFFPSATGGDGNVTMTGATEQPLDGTTLMNMPSLEGINYKLICGKRMFPEPRIVGGAKAAFGKWPWQISLRQWRTSTYLHKCGAALLNENWAITAAHCVDNVPPSDLLLRLGEYDLAVEDEPFGYQERRVQIVASHPQFDPRTFEYDLALLRFYEPVTFQPNIIPVCVPESDENFVGRTAYVTGWGRLYEDGPLPSQLQQVEVPVINNTICESMYRNAGYIEHIPHIFICAGWRKGGYDSCEGDSGGPMVIQRDDKRFLLAGVISWGIGCAEPNQPGVYTRISEFRDWINQILQF